jgi:hypothetical protein
MCWCPAFSPAGNEALILLAIHQGLLHPCFLEEILEEYAAVLARPKFAFPSDEIAAVLVSRSGGLHTPEPAVIRAQMGPAKGSPA